MAVTSSSQRTSGRGAGQGSSLALPRGLAVADGWMWFAPRIRDLGDQGLFRLERWDDMLQLAGSLRQGWVTAWQPA